MTALATDRQPITLRPKSERAHEGSDEITSWCPTCEERVVPMRDGTCGWCETHLADDVDAALAAVGLVEAAPSEAQGAPYDEQAGSAPVPSSPPPAEEEGVRPAVPPPATAAARRRAPRGRQQEEAAWRREAIAEWVAEQGEASIVEIRDQFRLTASQANSDITALERAGQLVRTGARRPSRVGQPSPILRPPDISISSHAPKGSDEAAQQAANEPGTPSGPDESPAGIAASERPEPEHGGNHNEGAAADGREAAAPAYLTGEPFEIPPYVPGTPEYLLGPAGSEVDDDEPCVDDEDYWRHRMLDPDRPRLDVPRPGGSDSSTSSEEPEPEPQPQGGASPSLTVHQELTVRYLRTLIGWVERGVTMNGQEPPEHIYERIERLLGIEDGVA